MGGNKCLNECILGTKDTIEKEREETPFNDLFSHPATRHPAMGDAVCSDTLSCDAEQVAA